MNSISDSTTKTRVVYAPPPSDPALFTSIYSIRLYENQDIEWQWLELPDGNRVVFNYKIILR